MLPASSISRLLVRICLLLLVAFSVNCASNTLICCSPDEKPSPTQTEPAIIIKKVDSDSNQTSAFVEKKPNLKLYPHQEDNSGVQCFEFLRKSPPRNTLFITGTGCDQFGLNSKDCAMKATISAQAQLATIVRSKVSSECRVETTLYQTAENSYVESKMVCVRDVKNSEVKLNGMITNVEKCFDSKYSGKKSFRTEVYKAHVRLTVPLTRLHEVIDSAEKDY